MVIPLFTCNDDKSLAFNRTIFLKLHPEKVIETEDSVG
jgi:hypothetical protein